MKSKERKNSNLPKDDVFNEVGMTVFCTLYIYIVKHTSKKRGNKEKREGEKT